MRSISCHEPLPWQLVHFVSSAILEAMPASTWLSSLRTYWFNSIERMSSPSYPVYTFAQDILRSSSSVKTSRITEIEFNVGNVGPQGRRRM
ncbi:hypothetical protein M413DRAFT_115349 [Hebeloma cylindrosporum]|uniref:Uncharacterized protein n=1 Tax=Hebeloma cylindrosporum TaxID=76867 RepID=A0A0C3CZZ0_HEBCY|nr:hypothetical protein M413DRAFT_115349 [Hebeloma cylindrosporum h7]